MGEGVVEGRLGCTADVLGVVSEASPLRRLGRGVGGTGSVVGKIMWNPVVEDLVQPAVVRW